MWVRRPLFTPSLALAALAVACIPGAALVLQYESSVPPLAQSWRLLTCHWSHWSVNHLFWSGATFAVLAAACERRGRARFVACVSVAALAIPLALRAAHAGPFTYRGLSGIDSALFALLAVTLLREPAPGPDGRTRRMLVLAALLTFGGKAAFELTTGAALFVDATTGGFAASPVAHIAGAAVGVVAGLIPASCWIRRRRVWPAR